MVMEGSIGTLITFQSEAAGSPSVFAIPYGSVADFADTDPSTGAPYLLLSDLERNIINWNSNPGCSLSIHTPINESDPDQDAMTLPRTTLVGTLQLVSDSDLKHAQAVYLQKHPMAEFWIDFADFHMYQFKVTDVYWVGGFGDVHYIGWISAGDYLQQRATGMLLQKRNRSHRK